MQIPTSWRTFSQKINCCESVKYHTFPPEAVYYVHPAWVYTKTRQLASRLGLRGDAGERGQKTGCAAENWDGDNPK